jgi:hypothetical protein
MVVFCGEPRYTESVARRERRVRWMVQKLKIAGAILKDTFTSPLTTSNIVVTNGGSVVVRSTSKGRSK